MATFMMSFLVILSLLALAPSGFSNKTSGGPLYPGFYKHSCPKAEKIVYKIVEKAFYKDGRMAASLLRLHFHDCFAQGCDASVLLDSSGTIISEKRSNANVNSARGFEVVERIKTALEHECPHIVSCADILALAARDSVVLAGGPSWDVQLGRRDSTVASLEESNTNIPPPTSTFQMLLDKFEKQGLNLTDVVALSGGHTIGNAQCKSFRKRLYNHTGDLNEQYAAQLRIRCPKSGGNQNLSALDPTTQFKFDNMYFKNLIHLKGLLNSDVVLFTENKTSRGLVKLYAENNGLFFEQFAESMIKMGSIRPLTGNLGEIRRICRRVNH